MTAECAFNTWTHAPLREGIRDYVDSVTTSLELRHILICKAWEQLSLAPRDKTDEWYLYYAKKVVHREELLYRFKEKRVYDRT